MNRLTCSSSPHSRPSRYDGSDEASQRRQPRHVSGPGLHGHVHVLGALRRVESAAPAHLLVRGTRHPGTSPRPAEGVVHSQNHRTQSRVRQLLHHCDGPTHEGVALPSRRGIHPVHSERRCPRGSDDVRGEVCL